MALAMTAVGTPYYVSPEICLGHNYGFKVGARARLPRTRAGGCLGCAREGAPDARGGAPRTPQAASACPGAAAAARGSARGAASDRSRVCRGDGAPADGRVEPGMRAVRARGRQAAFRGPHAAEPDIKGAAKAERGPVGCRGTRGTQGRGPCRRPLRPYAGRVQGRQKAGAQLPKARAAPACAQLRQGRSTQSRATPRGGAALPHNPTPRRARPQTALPQTPAAAHKPQPPQTAQTRRLSRAGTLLCRRGSAPSLGASWIRC